MPRRRPAQVRASLPIRRGPGRSIRQISRLSAPTLRAIAELERDRLRPSRIAQALDGWARFVRGPVRALDDPVADREALHVALRALPATAARELGAVVRPLDERYLTRWHSDPTADHIGDLITSADPYVRLQPADTFTLTVDLVYGGWLLAVVGDARDDHRLYASDLTLALDDLLAALVALTADERPARVSWEGEPVEYRWLFALDAFAHVHVRILRFPDRSARLPGSDGHAILDADLPLRTLVRRVTITSRALLTRHGEAAYARQWMAGPFPSDHLVTLERWLRRP